MDRRVPGSELTEAIASFQAKVVRLALDAIVAIVNAELVRRESIPLVRPAGRPRQARVGQPVKRRRVRK